MLEQGMNEACIFTDHTFRFAVTTPESTAAVLITASLLILLAAAALLFIARYRKHRKK